MCWVRMSVKSLSRPAKERRKKVRRSIVYNRTGGWVAETTTVRTVTPRIEGLFGIMQLGYLALRFDRNSSRFSCWDPKRCSGGGPNGHGGGGERVSGHVCYSSVGRIGARCFALKDEHERLHQISFTTMTSSTTRRGARRKNCFDL